MLTFDCTQGLSEEAVNVFRVMRADGIKPSVLVLNSLINAFGEDQRDNEAFSVLQYMKENVSYFKLCKLLSNDICDFKCKLFQMT